MFSRLWIVLGIATALATFAAVPESIASKAECDDPIDNIARIGWPSRLTLSITEDEENKECRFSIEGVATGSPPEQELANAIRSVRQFSTFGGETTLESQRVQGALLRSIPLLLTAASPKERIEDELQTDEFLARLQQCLRLISEEFLPPLGSPAVTMVTGDKVGADLSRFNARCAVATPNALKSLNDFLGGSVRLSLLATPVFVLRNEREDNLVEYLILPILRLK